MYLKYDICCGLDVHKVEVVACLRKAFEGGLVEKQSQRFTTTTSGLKELAQWLVLHRCQALLMESTGVYWRPVYFALTEHTSLNIIVCNAREPKHIPGRKSDQRDADWLSDLVAHNLVRDSFHPPPEIDALRELTRLRVSVVSQKTNTKNRIHKLLEYSGIKLASVASDIFGVSGRDMLNALVKGEREPRVLAEFARGSMRRKRDALKLALEGRFTDQHAQLLKMLLEQLDLFIAHLGQLDTHIAQARESFVDEITRLKTIPGIDEVAASVIISEIGVQMTHFGSAKRLTSWAGLAPGQSESAGKYKSTRAPKGNKWLRRLLAQCAWASGKTQTRLGERFRRLRARIGGKKAAMAVARHLLVLVYCLLQRGEQYDEQAYQHHARRLEDKRKHYALKTLEKMGFEVSLTHRDQPVSTQTFTQAWSP